MNVGAVVLAAGPSSRLGQPKQLLKYRGKALVRRAAEAALGAGCSPVIIVLGSERKLIAAELQDLPIKLISNLEWKRGVGRSLRVGIKAASSCDAVIIMACDQPWVTSELLRKLIVQQQQTLKPMVASAYAGTVGVPALFVRLCFEELLSLGDKKGAKPLLSTRSEEIARVDFPKGAIDIDTPNDYEALTG